MKKLIVLFLAMVIASIGGFAANQNVTQENITTTLNIYDAPTVSSVLLEDSDSGVENELDPTPGTTFAVTCSAVAEDLDGEADLTSAAGTLYLQSVGSSAVDNLENHYTDSSCTIDNSAGNANEANITCTFDVQFYAEPGTWECNITVTDGQSLTGSAQDTSEMIELLAIDVDDGALDFGSLAVGADTGSTDFTKTVTNNGNINISLHLNAWGDTLADTYSMTCDTGYIPVAELKVDTSASTLYSGKTSLTSNGATGALVSGFEVVKQSTGTTGTTGTLYFGMGVSGTGSPTQSCSGNLMFTGIAS